jgi:hypothetical protein
MFVTHLMFAISVTIEMGPVLRLPLFVKALEVDE